MGTVHQSATGGRFQKNSTVRGRSLSLTPSNLEAPRRNRNNKNSRKRDRRGRPRRRRRGYPQKEREKGNRPPDSRSHQMSPMDRRPPLAVSPRRLRSGRALHTTPSVQTPPPTCKNTDFSSRPSSSMKSLIQPVYQMISSELMALAKRAKEEFGSNDDLETTLASSSTCRNSPMFERGRFYEVYSARRNEKLKRKKKIADELIAQDPGIAIELAKRRNSKKVDSMRKSVPADFSLSRVNSLRSSVRSSKEMKKPSALTCSEKPAAIGTRSARKV